METLVRGISELKDYGKVEFKLKTIMDKKNINVYRLSKLTELKYSTVKSYYDNCPITRVDLDVLAKICYVLDCNINDVLLYKK